VERCTCQTGLSGWRAVALTAKQTTQRQQCAVSGGQPAQAIAAKTYFKTTFCHRPRCFLAAISLA